MARLSASTSELEASLIEAQARRQRLRQGAAVLLGWAAFIGIWAFATQFIVGPFLLPSPLKVAGMMWEIVSSGTFIRHFQASIGKVFAGFAVALLLGGPIGYLMGSRRYWKLFFQEPVLVFGSVPGITYAVMALVIFGISLFGPIMSVGIISMPYVALNVAEGVSSVDKRLVQMSQAFGRTDRDIFRHVVIPTVAPFAFAGVRLSFALAWKVEQLTEVFGSSSGVGFMIRTEFQDFSITGVLAWVLLFIIFMLLIERFILVRIENYLFRWRAKGADS